MLKELILVIKKKTNAFMIFSLSYYGFTLLGVFYKEFTEKSILPVFNTINEFPLIYLVAAMAIGISLYKNYRKTKSDKNPFYGLLWRSGVELQIMLWGTLASLMFSLGMLFSHSTEIQLGVSILAGIMMSLNLERDRIVDWSYNKWLNFCKIVDKKKN